MKKSIRNFVYIFILLLSISNYSIAQQDDLLFRKHIISSGWNGLWYGVAFDAIGEIDGAAAVGIPVITAGASAVFPLITNSSKSITANSLMLTRHGKTLGWAHGFGFATLIGGESAWNEDYFKLSIASGALTSIGLGRLGYSLGKKNNWDGGQVALYRHYGWIMPFTGLSLAAATVTEEARIWGASVLVFGAGGYYIADQIYKINQYSRGDVRATQPLALLTGGLAYGFAVDKNIRQDEEEFKESDLLLPAIGLLAGTGLGHIWLRNARLTVQQGTNSAYAAAGGAIIGFGICLLIDSDNITPYYTIPYITGLGAYAFAVESFKKSNGLAGIPDSEDKNDWEINFMPQNLLLNNKFLAKKDIGFGKSSLLLPAFTASYKF